MKQVIPLLAALVASNGAFAQAVDDVGGYAPPSAPGKKMPRQKSGVMSLMATGGLSFTGGESTMSPRFFRSGTPGDPCGTFGSGNYQYQEVPFHSDSSGTLSATVDPQTCGTGVYVSFHTAPFNPASMCSNHVWDFGSSVAFSESFAVPANTDMVMVVNGTNVNAPGLACGPVDYTLDGVGSAGITLASPASNEPIVLADELTFDDPRLFANPSGAFNISTEIDYSFSPGEVRYARLECPGVEFTTATIADSTVDASNNFGAINRVGSGDAIYFSITAGATPVVADDTFTIDGIRTVTTHNNVSCTYGLYDFPSQAQVGGSTGRVVTTSGAYISFAPSYSLVVNSQGATVANVESEDPAFSTFVAAAPTGSNQLAQIGGFSYGTVADVNGDTQPITLDGEAIELSDLMDSDTALVFGGDFSAAGDVFLDDDADCSSALVSADEFDESEARFFIGSDSYLDTFLCFEVGGDPIAAGSYTVSLDAVSADDDTYAVTDLGAYALGEITRNGAELQAPLAQVPSGYISRMVLTNTGNAIRDYEIAVFGEDGNVITTDNLTGTVPANGTLVVDLSTVLTAFTAAPRATLNVTVAGPNAQIQGLYQIVNTGTGAISNHVMVRPGKN